MKVLIAIASGVLCTAGLLAAAPAGAQQGAPMGGPPMSNKPATITSTLDLQLTIEEHEIEGAADAMPEDKYSFAPTNGEFKGVRTFAQEVKHIATVNNRFYGGVLGQPSATPASQFEAENGPDSVQTKAQIMQYLKDSFALGHKAIATINADNAFVAMEKPPIPFLRTPAAIVIFGCAHAMDHYGQMVEYLRDNGIVPPASRQRPPANPPAQSGHR
jgi:uncharacterized damage-inducible protein DinB